MTITCACCGKVFEHPPRQGRPPRHCGGDCYDTLRERRRSDLLQELRAAGITGVRAHQLSSAPLKARAALAESRLELLK